MTAQPTEPDESLAQVPARELRRLRALARIVSPPELAEAEEAARIEELDALEESGADGRAIRPSRRPGRPKAAGPREPASCCAARSR